MTNKKINSAIRTITALISVALMIVSCGGGSSSTESSNGTPPGSGGTPPGGGGTPGNTITPPLSVFAGDMGGAGNIDAVGITARFNWPSGSATDSADNIYVTEYNNHTIRKIAPNGLVTTFAGLSGVPGSADGPATMARFYKPESIAIDGADNIYVVDGGNHTIRKVTQNGDVTTLAGTAGAFGNVDGTGAVARFHFCDFEIGCRLSGIAVDNSGNAYVADFINYSLRKITPAGVVTTLIGERCFYGSDPATCFANHPTGVAVDSAGNVLVSVFDSIHKITPTGVTSVFAGLAGNAGTDDGSLAAARFAGLIGMTIDRTGNIYITSTNDNSVRKISTNGNVSTIASGTLGDFNFPAGITTDSIGNIYVVDGANHRIRKFNSSGVLTAFAGAAPVAGADNGMGTNARFNVPAGIASDSMGNIFIADHQNSSIRMITSVGVVSTFAGRSGSWDNINGTGSAARFSFPFGVATDTTDNVYVADTYNHAVRKITPAGVVTTLAGGSLGSTNGNGTAASFNFPYGIATDRTGNVYVADTVNHLIRKITPAGDVSTLAGVPFKSGYADGPGLSAKFNYPFSLATDSAGNVYVADTVNHVIRKITPGGTVSTFAGAPGIAGYFDGYGPLALFYKPEGIAIDSSDNIYVADTFNHAIRKITQDGLVQTVVGGNGKYGFMSGDLPGSLLYPNGVTISGTSLYITTANGVALARNVP